MFTSTKMATSDEEKYIYFTDSSTNQTLKTDLYGSIIFYEGSYHNGLVAGSIASYYYAHQRSDNSFKFLRFTNNSIKVKSDKDVNYKVYSYSFALQ